MDGGGVLVAGDLGNPEQAKRIAAVADQKLGGVDVLVNNAALAPTADNAHSIGEVSYPDWQRLWASMLQVNLLGAANLTYCVARRLIDRRLPGSVVNIGSRGAYCGESYHPANGASKAALHAFGQSLALALGPHQIAVSSVALASSRPSGRPASWRGLLAQGCERRARSVVIFTNTSHSTCSLTGYPGAAILDGSGSQILQANRALHGFLGNCGCSSPPRSRLRPATRRRPW